MHTTTVIYDEQGNKYTVSKSHKDMADLRKRFAEAMIKYNHLPEKTAEEYYAECKRRKESK